MKSFAVLRAAAFRGLKAQVLETVAPLELVEAVRQRYGFLKYPDLGKPNEPIDFQVGKLEIDGRIIKVQQFVITYMTTVTSLGAATRTSSDDADLFLDDLINWTQSEFNLDTASASSFPPAYHGQVEFVLETDRLATRFKELTNLGEAITNIIHGYGSKECPEYQLGGFSMHFDTNDPKLSRPIPTVFTVERRVGAPYSEQKYFSQAPLKTKDHKAVLERLEKLLLS